jgi:hypothetical protein
MCEIVELVDLWKKYDVLSFWWRTSGYKNCQSIENYHKFSRQAFGPKFSKLEYVKNPMNENAQVHIIKLQKSPIQSIENY